MSQFLKRFLAEEAGRLNAESGRFLALGVFGKHPGWDDHIEDLGLDTETLTLAKRVFYIQGVGGQIDTGAWEKLDAAQRLEGFHHVFLWQRSGQFLLGRMWSSSDGKGRTRYPMVVCAHCIGASLAWGLQQVLPRLEEIEAGCKATTSAADVRAIIERARNHLRGALAGAEKPAEYAPVAAEALNQFVTDPVFGPDQQGWFRFLYHLQNQMAVYLAGKFNYRTEGADPRPQHVRVPSGAPAPTQDLLLWTRVLTSRIDRAAPQLLITPLGERWTDIVLGEPSSHEFFCLRARPAALPLVTEVPYETDDAFKAKARTALDDFRAGKELAALGRADEPEDPEAGGWISMTQRWFKGKSNKKLFLLGGVLLAAAAGVVFFQNAGKLRPQEQAARSTPPPRQQAAPDTSPAATPPAAQTERLAKQQKQEQLAKEKASLEAARLKAEAEKQRLAAAATEEKERLAKAAAQEQERLDAAAAQEKERLAAAALAEKARMQAAQDAAEAEKAKALASTSAAAAALSGSAPPTNIAAAAPSTATNESSLTAPASSTPAVVETAAVKTGVRKVLTNSIGMILVWIAGLPGTAEGAYVSKYEVTQQQYERVIGTNPSKFKDPAHPVEMVNWEDASEFCRKLTSLESQAATMPAGCSYTLPTEAQWEFFLGDAKFDDAITSRTSSREGPAAVGSLSPNQYGLHDVLGNVWELCADPPSSSGERILKGGAYNNRKLFGDKASAWKPMERTTARHLPSDARVPDAGFRCIVK